MQNHKDYLIIPIYTWMKLVYNLKKSGKGVRESGAFLLGKRGSSKISSFILYESLDPHCLEKGYIYFLGESYIPLWEYCLKNKMQVLADVHTHPTKSVFQSSYDQENPMISQKGHIAMIIPDFAKVKFKILKGIGIYKYLGNHNWEDITKFRKVKISVL